jgi:hypothetical protein
MPYMACSAVLSIAGNVGLIIEWVILVKNFEIDR